LQMTNFRFVASRCVIVDAIDSVIHVIVY
jgi:hypothetical protein